MKKVKIIKKLALIISMVLILFINVEPIRTIAANVKEENKETEKEVTNICIDHDYFFTMEVGEKNVCKACVTPCDAKNKSVIWKSSNPEIATINQNGEIEAKAVGITQISAVSINGKISVVMLTVKNKKILVEQIILSKNEVTVHKGEEVEITSTILPDNATNKVIKWESTNTDVATVVDGKVKAVGEGSAIIKVISENNLESQCAITVKANKNNIPVIAAETVGGLSAVGAIGLIVKSKKKK